MGIPKISVYIPYDCRVSTLITYNYLCIFVNLLFTSTTLLLFLLHLYSRCFLIKFQSISQDHIWLKPNKTSIKKKSRIKVIPYNSSCQHIFFFNSANYSEVCYLQLLKNLETPAREKTFVLLEKTLMLSLGLPSKGK